MCHPPLLCGDRAALLELPAEPDAFGLVRSSQPRASFTGLSWEAVLLVCFLCLTLGFGCGRQRRLVDPEDAEEEVVQVVSPRRRRPMLAGEADASDSEDTVDTADTDGEGAQSQAGSSDGESQEEDIGFYRIGEVAVPLTVGLSRTSSTLLTVAPGTEVHVLEVAEEQSSDGYLRLRGRVAHPAAGWISLRTADARFHWAERIEAPELLSLPPESRGSTAEQLPETPLESDASQDAGLPPGWTARTSRSKGSVYYWHEATGKTQWDRPQEAVECLSGAAATQKAILAMASLEELRQLEPTNDLDMWMLWSARRVELDDPALAELDMTGMALLQEEPQLVTRLSAGLEKNTRLRRLRLSMTNLGGSLQAAALATALRTNEALEVLDLESNVLTPADLQVVFQALAVNTSLQELRCCNQFCEEEPGLELFEAAAEALEQNHTLVKLGLDVPLRYRHQMLTINKALTRNMDVARKARRSVQLEQQRKESLRRSAAWLRGSGASVSTICPNTSRTSF